MNKKLDEALVKDFPNLYADRHGNMRETCMCWGFACGDGWEPLIRGLSEKLEALIVEWKKENPDAKTWPCAAQVKEKFGTLRFYMNYGTDEIFNLIEEAEGKSCTTCEFCGAPDATIKAIPYWLSCVCRDCEEGIKKDPRYKLGKR